MSEADEQGKQKSRTKKWPCMGDRGDIKPSDEGHLVLSSRLCVHPRNRDLGVLVSNISEARSIHFCLKHFGL